MKERINPFLRAHGAIAGPLMRPRLTGFLASLVSGGMILAFLNALNKFSALIQQQGWQNILLSALAYCICAGLLYGQVYRRAANDLKGGWLFGASTGFILWMFNPLIWLPWLGREPILVGVPAILFLLSHVLHGALMGLLFPWLHLICKRQSALGNPSLAT